MYPSVLFLIVASTLATPIPPTPNEEASIKGVMSSSYPHNRTLCIAPPTGKKGMVHRGGSFYGSVMPLNEAAQEFTPDVRHSNLTTAFNPFQESREYSSRAAPKAASKTTSVKYHSSHYLSSEGVPILCTSKLAETNLINHFINYAGSSHCGVIFESSINILPSDEEKGQNECDYGFGMQSLGNLGTSRNKGVEMRIIVKCPKDTSNDHLTLVHSAGDPHDPSKEYKVLQVPSTTMIAANTETCDVLNVVTYPSSCDGQRGPALTHTRSSTKSDEVCWGQADGYQREGFLSFGPEDAAKFPSEHPECGRVPHHENRVIPDVPGPESVYHKASVDTRVSEHSRVYICGAILFIAICPNRPKDSGGAQTAQVNAAFDTINKDLAGIREWQNSVSSEIRGISIKVLNNEMALRALEYKEGLIQIQREEYKQAQENTCEAVMKLGGTCSVHGDCVTIYDPKIDIKKIANQTNSHEEMLKHVTSTPAGQFSMAGVILGAVAIGVSLLSLGFTCFKH